MKKVIGISMLVLFFGGFFGGLAYMDLKGAIVIIVAVAVLTAWVITAVNLMCSEKPTVKSKRGSHG